MPRLRRLYGVHREHADGRRAAPVVGVALADFGYVHGAGLSLAIAGLARRRGNH
jgi:hypothetical protein